jgi:hypothetical protein
MDDDGTRDGLPFRAHDPPLDLKGQSPKGQKNEHRRKIKNFFHVDSRRNLAGWRIVSSSPLFLAGFPA